MASKHIAAQWETLCKSAKSTGRQLAQDCTKAAADLIAAQSARFCERTAPSTKVQLETACTQHMSLAARITAIKQADAMGQAHPSIQNQILAEVAKFCDGDLPGSATAFLNLQSRNLELTATIAALCEKCDAVEIVNSESHSSPAA